MRAGRAPGPPRLAARMCYRAAFRQGRPASSLPAQAHLSREPPGRVLLTCTALLLLRWVPLAVSRAARQQRRNLPGERGASSLAPRDSRPALQCRAQPEGGPDLRVIIAMQGAVPFAATPACQAPFQALHSAAHCPSLGPDSRRSEKSLQLAERGRR